MTADASANAVPSAVIDRRYSENCPNTTVFGNLARLLYNAVFKFSQKWSSQ